MRTLEEIQNRSWLSEPRKTKKYLGRKYGMPQFYKAYKKLYWEDKLNHISQRQFHDIITDIHSAIIKNIVEEGIEFEMPLTTGLIQACTITPPKLKTLDSGKLNRAVDTKSTLELWSNNPEAFAKRQKVYFTNLHSNGKLVKIKYSTYKFAYFRGKQAVVFIPARGFKRNLAHVIKHRSDYPNAVYYELERWNTQSN